MRIKPLLKGFSTYIPGMVEFVKSRGSGGTNSASYCYGVWLKHLTLLWANGLDTMPKTLAEIGPGGSIGVGLAALLSGANRYYALDVVEYSNTVNNLKLLDELVAMFKQRAARPIKGWPDFDEYLDADLFPHHILTEERLEAALNPERVQSIRAAICSRKPQNFDIAIEYHVPWNDPAIIKKNSVDLIFSHSVLEHVIDLELTYSSFSLWLKPHGWMSHQIDLTSHGSSDVWNGHWAYPDWLWTLVVGKRPYLINRQPYSKHRDLLNRQNFTLLCELTSRRKDGIRREQLASTWKHIVDDDLFCSGAYVIAQKVDE